MLQASPATSSAQPRSGNQVAVPQGHAAEGDIEVQVVGVPQLGVLADMPHCRTQVWPAALSTECTLA